ncbi:hypothetical protein ACOSP7_024987 [Xanthoceras sorbifolium]
MKVSDRRLEAVLNVQESAQENFQLSQGMIASWDKVVGLNSVRLVLETTRGKDLSVGTGTDVVEPQAISICSLFGVEFSNVVDRPVKLDKVIIGPGQLPDMDEVMGQIECSHEVGLSETSSVIIGDSMGCVESPNRPKLRRWKKVARIIHKPPSPGQKTGVLRQFSRRGSKSPSQISPGKSKQRFSPKSVEDSGGKRQCVEVLDVVRVKKN